MFDWLIPLLIVAILLIWILDYLGLLDFLEVVAAVVSLIGAALVGTVKLLLRLVRHLAGSSDSEASTPQSSSPQASSPRGSGRFNRRSQSRSPGREHREGNG